MMTSLFEGDIHNPTDMLKEIQTERIVNQINSSSNVWKISDKMKKVYRGNNKSDGMCIETQSRII